MAALKWDLDTQRFYETGTKNGVLYPRMRDGSYPLGVAWNGLTGITETPEGGEPTDFYADDMKYITLLSAETFGGTITAYTYPDEWADCDGMKEVYEGMILSQQQRKAFGLVYKTVFGNDTEMNDFGYKLHLIYNALTSPSERAYKTINDSPELIEFSWGFKTTPVMVSGYKPTSLITVDSTRIDPGKLVLLERRLFGFDGSASPSLPANDPHLPAPDDVLTLLSPSNPVTYVLQTPAGTENPKGLQWFEQVGTTGTTYVLSQDPTVNPNKNYYVAT